MTLSASITHFAGIDIGYGLSSGASKTAVVTLPRESDIPLGCTIISPDKEDFEERIVEIAAECRQELIFHGATSPATALCLISVPKLSPMRYKKKNAKTGLMENKIAMSRSTVDIAQIRGAIRYAIRDICTVRSAVESKAKLAFAGSGRADKETIRAVVKRLWPACPDNIKDKNGDVVDAYQNAYSVRANYLNELNW